MIIRLVIYWGSVSHRCNLRAFWWQKYEKNELKNSNVGGKQLEIMSIMPVLYDFSGGPGISQKMLNKALSKFHSALLHLEKSSNIPKIWQTMKKKSHLTSLVCWHKWNRRHIFEVLVSNIHQCQSDIGLLRSRKDMHTDQAQHRSLHFHSQMNKQLQVFKKIIIFN